MQAACIFCLSPISVFPFPASTWVGKGEMRVTCLSEALGALYVAGDVKGQKPESASSYPFTWRLLCAESAGIRITGFGTA